MHPPLSSETKGFWQQVTARKKAGYRYWCTTPAHNPAASLVDASKHVRLSHGETAYWGFRNVQDREAFMQRYGGTDW